MVRCLRITALPTVDNPVEFPLYVDVITDDSNMVSGMHPIFGFQGEIGQRSGASMPFILHSDGRMDFGEKYLTTGRFYHLDLRNVSMDVGRLLTIHGEGYQASFRISELITLV